MIFTKDEMNFLCQIHEVKTLVGFPMFSLLSTKQSEVAQQGLLDKGILIGEELSEFGLQMLKGILLYIQAKEMIKIGHVMFAKYDKQDYVMIAKNKDDFEVELVTQDEMVVFFMGILKHWDQVEDLDYRKKLVSKQVFLTFMNEHPNVEAISYQRIQLDEKKEQSAIFFIHDGYLQHYDAKNGHLDQYPKRQIQKGIEAIFE